MKHSAFDDFSESAQDALDFARCQRADGSYYGTGGQCRKGTPVGPKEVKAIAKKAAEGDERAKQALEKMAEQGDPDAKKALEAMGDEKKAAPEEVKELTDADSEKLLEEYKKIEDVDSIDGYDDASAAVEMANDAIREDDGYLENDNDTAFGQIDEFMSGDYYRQDEALDLLESSGKAPEEVAKLREEWDENSSQVLRMRDEQEAWTREMGGTDSAYDDDNIIGMMKGGWANQSGTYDEDAVIAYGQNLAGSRGLKVSEDGARELAMHALSDAGDIKYKPGDTGFSRDDIRKPNPWFSNEEKMDRITNSQERLTRRIQTLAEGTDAEGLL